MEILDTLGFLLGTWDVDRSITDQRSGTRGSFVGTAAMVAAEPGADRGPGGRARYDETGEFRFGTHAAPASRHLEYQAGADGGAVGVRFTDGRRAGRGRRTAGRQIGRAHV